MAYFIPYEKYKGNKNMEIDESLLDLSIKNSLKPILRLYGWSNPTLSLGRNQSLTGINLEYCQKQNIDIIKRPTGGRAVLHEHELTYCFITPVEFLKNGASVIESYKEISEALIIGFKKLNIDLQYPEYKKVSVKQGYCMNLSTGSDLIYKGKKIIGSAQLRKQNYILQHGSILIDINKSSLLKIFNSSENFLDVATLINIRQDLNDLTILCNAVKAGFEEKFLFDFESFPF